MNIIRDYRQGDEAQAQQLLIAGLQPYGLAADLASTDADIIDIQRSYIDRGGVFRFLESEGTIAGMYGLYRLSAASCELRKMYLQPEQKGKGFGHLLMKDALEQAAVTGFKEMVLETNSCLTEAIAMYHKYGFEPYTAPHLSERCNYAMRRNLRERGPEKKEGALPINN